MLAQLSHISLEILVLTLPALLIATVSASLCPTSKLMYRPYAFQPNCSQSLTLNTRNNLTCVMAAATSSVVSAVVKPLASGDQCLVIAALCPRYRLANFSTVLMPASMIALEHVVMSVKSGCGRAVLDVITQSAQNSDYAVQPAHPDAAILPDTFRSGLLDDMQRLISRLIYKHFIVQLYRNSSVVVRLVFDVGVSSESVTVLNWFSKSRLIKSWPVTNLASMSTNIFSIVGETENGISRRFNINFNYGGCENDKGLMAVLDVKHDVCAMYQFSQAIPRIVYSTDVSQPMAASIRDADYMAVLIR